jgi:hypothetical protein
MSLAAMSDTLARWRAPSRPGLREPYRVTPWWLRVLAIFVASRIVTTIILLVFAAIQPANPWTGAHPDYFSFAGIWDGNWYHIVAASGYPAVLPRLPNGQVNQNAWAFLPAYPYLVGAISAATRLSFNAVGVVVSVAFAAGTALMFYRLLVPRLSTSAALFSVALFCFAPLSPILQVDYAESMQLFFLACALYYLLQRRYWMILPFVAVMSFTKPSGLAFALAMGLHVVYRFVVRKRDGFSIRDAVAAVSVTIGSVILGYAWPIIAGVVTGNQNAYEATEFAWREQYIGSGSLIPFAPWIQAANWWSDYIGVHVPGLAVGVLVVVVALFAILMFSPWVKSIGVDLRLWVASWIIYLLAVFFPQSSVFRLLMPAFPLLAALGQVRSRTVRIAILALFVVGQIEWIYICWWVDGYDWTPP